jgi:hypothetical protein
VFDIIPERVSEGVKMMILDVCSEVIKIQKLRRAVSYAGFYCFTAALTFFYTNNT